MVLSASFSCFVDTAVASSTGWFNFVVLGHTIGFNLKGNGNAWGAPAQPVCGREH